METAMTNLDHARLDHNVSFEELPVGDQTDAAAQHTVDSFSGAPLTPPQDINALPGANDHGVPGGSDWTGSPADPNHIGGPINEDVGSHIGGFDENDFGNGSPFDNDGFGGSPGRGPGLPGGGPNIGYGDERSLPGDNIGAPGQGHGGAPSAGDIAGEGTKAGIAILHGDVSGAMNHGGTALDMIGQDIHKGGSDIGGPAGGAVEKGGDLISTIGHSIHEAGESIEKVVEAVADGVKAGVDAAVDGVKAGVDAVVHLFTGDDKPAPAPADPAPSHGGDGGDKGEGTAENNNGNTGEHTADNNQNNNGNNNGSDDDDNKGGSDNGDHGHPDDGKGEAGQPADDGSGGGYNPAADAEDGTCGNGHGFGHGLGHTGSFWDVAAAVSSGAHIGDSSYAPSMGAGQIGAATTAPGADHSVAMTSMALSVGTESHADIASHAAADGGAQHLDVAVEMHGADVAQHGMDHSMAFHA